MRLIKKLVINGAILLLSFGIGLVICEFASRLVLNPSDFLSLQVVSDPILGWVTAPSPLGGYDKWGFRNRKVPETSEIVAVGDSHTYGNTARMVDSWPYVLGQLIGRHVYDLALGGYGPNQYFYLTNTKAFSLKPRMIIWGMYMGDDFANAYEVTYGLDYWASLRQLSSQSVDPNIWQAPPTDTMEKRIRVWLSRHSVLYQLVFHSGITGRVAGEVQIRNASQLYPGLAASLVVPDKNILEAFRPKGLLAGLDQKSPNVREGMRITFKLLQEMNETCKQKNVEFLVVIIPTKEMVFSDYLEHNPNIALDDVIDELVANERLAEAETFNFLNDNHIPYVYPLAALKRNIGQGLYAKSAGDMHPNKNGYRVIAESVADYLKQSATGKQSALPPQ